MSTENDIEYRSLDTQLRHEARCTALSGSQISFICEQAIDEGKALEVIVHTHNPKNPYFTTYIETLKTKKIQQEQYEVQAAIKIIKGN